MSSPSIIAVANETQSTVTRLTRDGRRLAYEMTVLQQPQRARACGSASADRRPVDPPPVVELKVYQLEGERKIDRTFTHDANFILYTTLETARPIAQPRSNGSAVAPPGPVLTGAAVAGMAYLDRPNPAGYFIFPDLSVRHEGFYRLSFNLFEELKNAHDADADEMANPSTARALRSPGMADVRHVHFRLEVKSEPFQVFSAKKFPGLAESTPLSRAVADQGCRVRIRRDVRMRRRDTKHSNDEYAVNDAYSRGSPEVHSSKPTSERGRSMSNTTNEAPAYHLMERRSSPDLYAHAPTFHPPTDAHGSAATSPTRHSYGMPGRQHAGAPMPSTTHYMPPAAAAAYSFHAYQTKGYDVPPPYSPPGYELEPRSSFDCPRGSHSASGSSSHVPLSSSYSSPPSKHSSTTSLHSLHSQHSQHSHASFHSMPRPRSVDGAAVADGQLLPPLKGAPYSDARHVPLQQTYTGLAYSTTVAMPTSDLPPYHVAMSSPTEASSTPPSASSSARDVAVMVGKRMHGEVFDSSSLAQAAWGGHRPDLATHGLDVPQLPLEDGSLVDLSEQADFVMEYKRADGSKQWKKCPVAV